MLESNVWRWRWRVQDDVALAGVGLMVAGVVWSHMYSDCTPSDPLHAHVFPSCFLHAGTLRYSPRRTVQRPW